jgi:hypothetical protein
LTTEFNFHFTISNDRFTGSVANAATGVLNQSGHLSSRIGRSEIGAVSKMNSLFTTALWWLTVVQPQKTAVIRKVNATSNFIYSLTK